MARRLNTRLLVYIVIFVGVPLVVLVIAFMGGVFSRGDPTRYLAEAKVAAGGGKDPDNQFLLAQIAMHQNPAAVAVAMQADRAALALKPTHLDAQRHLAELCLAVHFWKEAQREVDRLIALDPTYGKAYLWAAVVQMSMAEAEPGGKQVSRLGPGENPRNGSQVTQVSRAQTAAGPGAQADVLNQIDRRGLPEVGSKTGRFVNEFPVEATAAGGELRRMSLPGGNLSSFDPAEVEQVGVEHRGHQLLEVPLSDGRIRVFEGNHLALFGDAQPSTRSGEGLRLDAAMRLAAAAVDGSPLTVKKREADAVFLRHLGQPLLGVKKCPIGSHVTAVFDGI